MYRILRSGDEAIVEAFLRPQVASSMFLLSNMRESGLTDRGVRAHGTYAGAFEREELVGIVAHYWNGNLIPQSPLEHLEALCRLAVAESGRPVRGAVGPNEQCFAILDALHAPPESIHMATKEQLYCMQLDDLRVPPALADGVIQARRATPADLPLLAAWRADYAIEALAAEETPELHRQSEESIARQLVAGHCWVTMLNEEVVAMSAFNARIEEAVQIGGVYTPPAYRRQGYARAAVAQSLLDARAAGVVQAILFTDVDNVAADKAYRGIGFRTVGDFAIILLGKRPANTAKEDDRGIV
jgi:ribosomal protein S18 acetylase RimI-like enzyme